MEGAATWKEEAEGIRMGDFFNKLVGRASGGVKAQVTRRGLAGASDALLMSDVRHITLPFF